MLSTCRTMVIEEQRPGTVVIHHVHHHGAGCLPSAPAGFRRPSSPTNGRAGKSRFKAIPRRNWPLPAAYAKSRQLSYLIVMTGQRCAVFQSIFSCPGGRGPLACDHAWISTPLSSGPNYGRRWRRSTAQGWVDFEGPRCRS